ncbi:MAG: hypothetical protein WD267_05225 [Balneolales bacterium]
MPYLRFLPFLIALLAGMGALFIPLLRDFHIESAVPAALIGAFFASAYAARGNSRKDWRGLVYVMGVIYAAAIPIIISNISRGCMTTSGLGFWVFYPAISMYFGYAVGRYFRITGWKKPIMFSVLILMIISIGTLLIELYYLPQVYFHNHVWGGWPGTIYDVEVDFTSSELFFRSMTFSWASLLWLAPSFWKDTFSKFGVILFTLSLMFSYTQLSEGGIISPRSYLQSELNGHLETEHFHIYYSREHFTESEMRRNAGYHEFHLQEIAEILELDLPPADHKIESYLYGHPWQMKNLVGAKNVSYVPVWSPVDQLHIGKNAIDRTLRHELVHVMAKQFGNRWISASWSVGLLEGVAVALSPASRQITTNDQAMASTGGAFSTIEMRRLLSPTGFYGGRGPMNYTVTGSFVDYLLNEYPVDYFKEAYRSSNLEEAYPVSLDILIAGWQRHLDTVEFDMREQQAGELMFSTPSIFEEDCPRRVCEEQRLTDTYLYHMAEADTASALRTMKSLLRLNPENSASWRYWSTLGLNNNHIWEIVPDHHPVNPFFLVRQADYAMLTGTPSEAEIYLRQFKSALKDFSNMELNSMLHRRSDHQKWSQLVVGLHRTSEISLQDFEAMDETTRFYTLQRMLNQNNRNDIAQFIRLLDQAPYDSKFFQVYLMAIEHAALYHEYELAQKLISYLVQQKLRPLEKEALHEMVRFNKYLKSIYISNSISHSLPNIPDDVPQRGNIPRLGLLP